MDLETISEKFTEETLDAIIRNHGGIKHTSWRLGNEFRKEDAFLSELCRLIVTGIKEDKTEFELRMIVKTMPKSLTRRMSVRSVDFFRNEIHFYENVLKQFESFQKARNVTDGLIEFPRCYASFSDGENDFIALEDLSYDGYTTIDRMNGLDLNRSKRILTILGKFHAISLAIRDQERDEFDKMVNFVEETYYNDKFRAWYEPYQVMCVASRAYKFCKNSLVASYAVALEYGGTVYESKMKEFTGSSFYDTMCRLTRETGQFSVICHGDLWIPNFLFKYNTNNADDMDVKIIDFQLARIASPATDISFFIYACLEQDIREQHFDELIQIYHHSAISTLTALGSNASIFPYSALQQELKQFARFGVGMAMGALSLCVASKVRDIDESALLPMDKIISIKPCKTKEGRLRMANNYKHAVDYGFL